ncbi:acyloxyacyl hydrolase [Thalassospiraceae bacterium LMO-SO8]|nr:acyloxyacyl hydrolase [Alphaproteobacteria bacterium LMO-S08]WND77792.1 acyloxyacyl hydrolase [Thalassospiraceae bacterium LMO-SO8]
MFKKLLIPALLAAVTVMPSGTARAEDDPDFLTLAVGKFDIFRNREEDAEIRLDYRFGKKLWIFKPFLTGAYVTNNSSFIGAGLLVDIYLGRRFVLTPQFSPTFWRGKTSNLDLGHALEFRSRLELAYRFDDRSRIGISIDHSSNAGLGDGNPGVESVMLNYSMSMDRIKGLFK